MNSEQFKVTVSRLEEYAQRNPQMYRRKVGLIALLGYVYIAFVLLLVVSMVLVLVALILLAHIFSAALLQMAFALSLVASGIIRSLWVRFPRPEGIPLTRDEAPELFRVVDDLTAQLKTHPFHHVLLTDDFNAAVFQFPRLGILGWQENYLLLGLPLMQALPLEHVRSIVAHEMGHLSQNHSRFSGWIYRVFQTWQQMIVNLARRGNRGAWLFDKFLRWYAPFFGAYSFVLRRADEYVADRCAAELVGVQATGDALINTQVRGQFLHESFWPDIYKQAETDRHPPEVVFSQLSTTLRTNLAFQDASQWLAKAFLERSEYDDTHPCLRDRLNSLGYFAEGQTPQSSTRNAENNSDNKLPIDVQRFTKPVEQSAAEVLLGGQESRLIEQLNGQWHTRVASSWEQHHQKILKSRQELEELEIRAPGKPLTNEEEWQRVVRTLQVRGDAEALPVLRAFVQKHPQHRAGRFLLGHTLLEQGDETGIAPLESLMKDDPSSTPQCCQRLYEHCKAQGRYDEADRYRARAETFVERVQSAPDERQTLSWHRTFAPHRLDATETVRIQKALAESGLVQAAYLVRKNAEYAEQVMQHILGVKARQQNGGALGAESSRKLAEKLNAQLGGIPELKVVVFDNQTRGIEEAMAQIEGAKVFPR